MNMVDKNKLERIKSGKRKVKWSSSGRAIFPNKKHLSFDSDSAELTKKSNAKKIKSATAELDSLKELVRALENKSEAQSSSDYRKSTKNGQQTTNNVSTILEDHLEESVVIDELTFKKDTEPQTYQMIYDLPVATLPLKYTNTNVEQLLQEILLKITSIEQQNEDIKTVNTKMATQLEKLTDEMKLLRNEQVARKVTMGTLCQTPTGFPLETQEQFVTLEEDTEETKRSQLLTHLKNMGACKLREFISMAFKHTFTDELLDKFTWLGSQNTLSLQNAKITKTLYSAAEQCREFAGPSSVAQFKNEATEVLRATKQRYRNKCAKDDPNHAVLLQIEKLRKKLVIPDDDLPSNDESSENETNG